jgi:hypothetical protein
MGIAPAISELSIKYTERHQETTIANILIPSGEREKDT